MFGPRGSGGGRRIHTAFTLEEKLNIISSGLEPSMITEEQHKQASWISLLVPCFHTSVLHAANAS